MAQSKAATEAHGTSGGGILEFIELRQSRFLIMFMAIYHMTFTHVVPWNWGWQFPSTIDSKVRKGESPRSVLDAKVANDLPEGLIMNRNLRELFFSNTFSAGAAFVGAFNLAKEGADAEAKEEWWKLFDNRLNHELFGKDDKDDGG